MAADTEFKFPDEIPVEKEKDKDDLQIEIVDDTPEVDKNRGVLPKEVVEELEKDDLEEYSEKVQKRLKQLKRVWHDERREKERLARERDEATRFAEANLRENQALKQRLGSGEKIYKDEMTKSTKAEIDRAKEKLKAAYEAGDSEAITNAQEELTDAKLKMRDVDSFKPSLQDKESGVQASEQPKTSATSSPAVDPKAEQWKEKNKWFGVDEEMTALALGLHEKLVRSGVDPRSDDYYDRVNKTMRQRFPENFEEETASTTEKPEKEKAPARKPAATVVTPASLSSAPRQVRLTPTQVALAKKLGLTLEAYARQVVKLESENQNG